MAVVRGHLNYYAVPGNIKAVEAFRDQATRHWYQALRRRTRLRLEVSLWADRFGQARRASRRRDHARFQQPSGQPWRNTAKYPPNGAPPSASIVPARRLEQPLLRSTSSSSGATFPLLSERSGVPRRAELRLLRHKAATSEPTS